MIASQGTVTQTFDTATCQQGAAPLPECIPRAAPQLFEKFATVGGVLLFRHREALTHDSKTYNAAAERADLVLGCASGLTLISIARD